VRADLVLLVDHPEANARIAAVEVGQELGERGALRLDWRQVSPQGSGGDR
jgi:hypothetical protein